MRIEELLDPENLPEDLHWLATEFELNPDDPVFALIAWHWHRVQQGEDSLRGAAMELKAAVDHRIDQLMGATETALTLQNQLEAVRSALEVEPLALSQRIEADLRRPVSETVAEVSRLSSTVDRLVRTTETMLRRAQRRQALASFVIGVGFGGSLILWCT
jgi:hypothetical protein